MMEFYNPNNPQLANAAAAIITQDNTDPVAMDPMVSIVTDGMASIDNNASWVDYEEEPMIYDTAMGSHNDTMMRSAPPPVCLIYDFAIEAVAMGVLCLFGFVGNILSTICLRKDKSKTATPFLLISLEIADTLFLIAVLFIRVLPTIVQYTRWPALLPIFPYLGKYVFPLALVCEMGTIYLTLLVTLNRYVSVCLPYQANDVCSPKNARIHVVLVWIFSFLYNIPRFFEYEIVEHISLDNQTFRSADPSEMAQTSLYKILYSNIMYSVVMFLVPLTILCILNARLIIALNRTKQKRKQLLNDHSSRSEDDITLVLIVVVLVFVVCQTPALITQVLSSLLPSEVKRCPNAFFFYERISDLLVVTNSSINFLIYSFCSKRFRQILASTICDNSWQRHFVRSEHSAANGHTTLNRGDQHTARAHTKYTTITVRHSPQENTVV